MKYEPVTLSALAVFCDLCQCEAIIDGDNMIAHIFDIFTTNWLWTVKIC